MQQLSPDAGWLTSTFRMASSGRLKSLQALAERAIARLAWPRALT